MSFQGLPNQVANITDIPGGGVGAMISSRKYPSPIPTLEGTYVLDPYPARFFCTLQVGRLLSTYSFPR